jgi:hypothetical protein
MFIYSRCSLTADIYLLSKITALQMSHFQGSQMTVPCRVVTPLCHLVNAASCLAYASALKMEEIHSSEMSVEFYGTTRRYSSWDRALHYWTYSVKYSPFSRNASNESGDLNEISLLRGWGRRNEQTFPTVSRTFPLLGESVKFSLSFTLRCGDMILEWRITFTRRL